MKWIIAALFLPIVSWAQTAPPSAPAVPAPVPPKCRFSNKLPEQNEIKVKGCPETFCSHVVICGKRALAITCKSKSGVCDGYDANECFANQLSESADFETEKPAR